MLIPDIVTANTGYIGLRAPSNKIARELIRISGVPIAAPSATPSGKTSSTSMEHLVEYFSDKEIRNNKEQFLLWSKICD